MPVIINDFQAVADNVVDLVSTAGDTAIITKNGIAFNTAGGNTIVGGGANQNVIVNGEVLSTGNGIFLFGENADVMISSTGSVQQAASSEGSVAVWVNAYAASVVNSGTISGDYGIYATGHNFRLFNDGSITSTKSQVDGNANANPIEVRHDTVAAGEFDIDIIENHGTIYSSDVAIDIDEVFDAGDPVYQSSIAHIINSGLISGDISLGGFDDKVLNSGTINGDIYLGDDDDVYSGEDGFMTRGTAVYLGAGDDELDGGAGRERVFDGAGDDDVSGNGGNDSFRAGSGANNYDGGEGQDYLSYFDFNSRVRIDLEAETTSGGRAGNAASNDTFTSIERVGGTNGGGDTLLGTSEANSMFGFGGEDKLYGRGGNDKLVGGDGDDFFDGGGGTDRLFGGEDNDTFHFDRGEGDDLIFDFENNIDTIEFDNFGNFSNAAFLAQYATEGAGNVYFDFGANGSVLVFDTTIGQLQNDIDIV